MKVHPSPLDEITTGWIDEGSRVIGQSLYPQQSEPSTKPCRDDQIPTTHRSTPAGGGLIPYGNLFDPSEWAQEQLSKEECK